MANYFVSSRNDFSLTDPSSSDVIGFICDRAVNVPHWKELDGQYLVDLFRSTQPDVTSMNPEEDLPISLGDFRSGFGMEVYDYDDPLRYFSSYGCDLRFKSGATLSYGATAITVPQYVTQPTTTFDMEGAADWTTGAGTAARDGAVKQAGLYSWKVSQASWAYKVPTWDDDYQGTVVNFQCYVYNTGAKIGIKDDSGSDYSAAQSAGASWELLSVTKTLDAAATYFQLTLTGDGSLDSRYFDTGTIYVATNGAPLKGIDFNDLHYIPIGTVLYKLDGTATGLTYVYNFPVAITSLAAMTIAGVDYLFIGQGLANAYYYMVIAETFTASNAAIKTIQFFVVYNTATPTMAGNNTNSTITTTINPLNAGTAWAVATQVDKDFYDITGLHTEGGTLYITKEDTVYYLNSAGAVQSDLTPELLSLKKSTDNGKCPIFYKDNWYFPWGDQSLLESGTANDWKSPGLYCTNLSSFVGQVFAVAADDMYLWAVVDNSTKVEVMAGRYETIEGTAKWVWHPYQEIALTGCNAAWVSSFYRKSLYIASTETDENLYFIPLPIGYGDIDGDANRSFLDGGYFETPWLHGRFKSDDKAWIKATATLGHAYDTKVYWECWYKTLGGSYVDAGDFVGTSTTDRTQALYLSTTAPVSSMMQFKLVGKTDDTDLTPILLDFDVRAILYGTKKNLIWAKVRVAKEVVTKDGKSVDLFTKRKDCLENCRNATRPVAMTDIDGSTIYVRFLTLPKDIPWREPVADEKGRDTEWAYNLLMLRVPLA